MNFYSKLIKQLFSFRCALSKRLLLVSMFLFVFSSFSQNKLDTLAISNYENEFQTLLLSYEIKKARHFVEELLKRDNKNFNVLAYKLKSNLLNHLGKTDSAKQTALKALKINNDTLNKFYADLTFNIIQRDYNQNIGDSIVYKIRKIEHVYKSLNNYRGLCFVNYFLARYYLQEGGFYLAENAINKTFEYNKFLKSNYFEALNYDLLSRLQVVLGNYEKGRETTKKAATLFKDNNNTYNYVLSNANIAVINILKDENWHETRTVLNETLKFINENEIPDNLSIANIRGMNLSTLLNENKIPEAEIELEKINYEYEKTKSPKLKFFVILAELELLSKKNNIIQFEAKRKEINITKTTPELKSQFLKLFYEFDLKNKNYKKAFNNLENYWKLKDSLTNSILLKNIMYNETKYETEKKENENLQLKADNAEQAIKVEKANANMWLLIVGLLAAIISAFFIWRRYRIEAKAKKVISYQKDEIEQQKNKVELLQKELHHRIKNNLSFIDLFINLAKGRFTDQAYQNKLNELQNRMRSMFEVHKQLFQKEDVTAVKAKTYIDTLVSNVQTAFANPNIAIANTTTTEQTLMADISFPVGLIVNEFVTNAYKYAFNPEQKGSIVIVLDENANTYSLSLKDNGKGLPADFDINNLDSFGLETIQLLTKEYKGTFSINGTNGVSVLITLPKTAA